MLTRLTAASCGASALLWRPALLLLERAWTSTLGPWNIKTQPYIKSNLPIGRARNRHALLLLARPEHAPGLSNPHKSHHASCVLAAGRTQPAMPRILRRHHVHRADERPLKPAAAAHKIHHSTSLTDVGRTLPTARFGCGFVSLRCRRSVLSCQVNRLHGFHHSSLECSSFEWIVERPGAPTLGVKPMGGGEHMLSALLAWA